MDNQDTALELASTVISWSGYLLAAIGVLLTISAIVFFFGVQPRIVRKETREYLQSEQGQELLKDVAKGMAMFRFCVAMLARHNNLESREIETV